MVSSADDEDGAMMSPVDTAGRSARSNRSQPQSPGLRVSFDEGDSRGNDTETQTAPTSDSQRSANDDLTSTAGNDTSVVSEGSEPAVFISDNYVREDQVRQMSPQMKMLNGAR